MDNYLTTHYKGKYRVYAHYDLATLDYVRDYDGNFDDSFADFYLAGTSNIEIKHGYREMLACYIPALQKGNNVLRKFYTALTHKTYENKSMSTIIKELKEKEYVHEVDILDSEVFFTFHNKYLDILAPIIKLKTSGAKISPFSIKNLPKATYQIPEEDMLYYKRCAKDIESIKIAQYSREFFKNEIHKTKSDVDRERLKRNEWLHKHGYWDKWCQYLNKKK